MRIAILALSMIVTLLATGSNLGAQQRPQAAQPGGEPERVLRVAVVITPDVLLDSLIATFEAESGYRVVMQITEGVYDLAREGKVDLVIAHYGHPGTEPFMAEGLGRWPHMVFANQAVLIGPSSDPAGIRGLTDAAEAMSRIARRGAEFLVNNAITERYLADVLWQAGGAPPKRGWQIDLGLRDQPAIEMAAQRGAYTVWGIVPFVRLQQQRLEQQRPLGMEALVVGDPLFQRVMVSIVVNSSRIARVDEEAARAFERFLLEPRIQARMRQFRHHGLSAQTWWPAGRNNSGAELSGF
jgi:tungstate transport system substrate-binding protein